MARVRLYVSLKAARAKHHNVCWLSYRDAHQGLIEQRKIRDGFRIQHTALLCSHDTDGLGVEGKGRAPQCRLTELGTTRKTSAATVPNCRLRISCAGTEHVFEPKRRANTPGSNGCKIREIPSTTGETGCSSGGNVLITGMTA